MIDVLYIVGTGSRWEDNELRYSMRALHKYGRGFGRVVVCGHKPDWCTAEHIPAEDIYPTDKDANMIHKVLVAIENGISRNFIYAHDDQFLLQEQYMPLLPYWHKGELATNSKTDIGYRRRIRNTRRMLKASGFGTLHYDVHAPMRMDAAAFRDTFFYGRLRWWVQPNGPGIVVKSTYGNVWGVGGVEVEDCLVYANLHETKEDVSAAVEGKPFFSARARIGSGLIDFLAEKYPDPSPWEKIINKRHGDH